jgi:two-component system sensor histidine kinase SenX3
MDAALGALLLLLIGATIASLAMAVRDHGRTRPLQEEATRLRSELDDQRRTSEETRAGQDLILSSMQDGILLFDASGVTAFSNAALERHMGIRPASTAQLFPPSLRETVERTAREREAGSALIETGEPVRFMRVLATPAGDDGAVLVVVRDVTEAHRIDAIRRDFVANASHELKTPAASIQAAAETLHRAASDDPDAVAHFSAQIEREAVRLSRIVADLLDLSRLESGSELAERVPLHALVREEAQRALDEAQGLGLTLDVRAAEDIWVDGSARDLSLLIRNLVDNAIRYTRPEGSVTVGVTIVGDDAVLTVADTGIGIPSKDLPRVFERFYRVDRARSRETGGTGLGLSIVRHVAENHGGAVGLRSELGLGTTITVRLPRRPAPP